jgi:hypothetical protein
VLFENTADFNVISRDGSSSKRSVKVEGLWHGRHCSRDVDVTRTYLDGRRAEGYSVHGNPNLCKKSRYLLTNETTIEVQGPQTSGEVEYVTFVDDEDVFVSVGSDHNDRSLESLWTDALGKIYDTAKSKQMVPAVVAREAWKYEDIIDHWDRLVLRSHVTVAGHKVLYQDFSVSKVMDPQYHFRSSLELAKDGNFLFGGSWGAAPGVPSDIYQFQKSIRGLNFPRDFHFEIHDPILGRTISHGYDVLSLEPDGSMSL